MKRTIRNTLAALALAAAVLTVPAQAHTMALDGVTGGEQLQSDIKMILNLAGNCLINQHGDINRTAEILRDTSKCEFIVCSDLSMTASAKFADVLLPGVSMFEGENITQPWQYGDFVGFNNQVIEPLYEGRFEYDWLSEVAEKIGLDPAVMAAPFISTIVDVLSLVIYFAFATALLGL